MMRVVYIASSYRHGSQAVNVAVQMNAAHKLMDLGISPITPLLTHFLEIYQQRPEEDWLKADLELVRRSDAVWRIPGESKGADGEVALAKELGIPVFFTLEQIEAWLWADTHRVDTSGMDVQEA
jgi:hypothetical protein